MRRKILAWTMALMLLYGSVMTVSSHTVPDLTQKGSIEITFVYNNQPVQGGNLELFRVGEVLEENGDYYFGVLEEFKGSGVSLENVQSPEVAEALAEYAKDLQGLTKDISSEGKVDFEQLELGLYLLIQEEAAEGFHEVNPFLVSVPKVVDGEYVYQVDASPKVQMEPKGTVPPGSIPPPPDTTPTPETPPPNTTPPPGSIPPSDTPKLPQTGQLNWPVPLLAVSGLWLFTMGWVLRFGRKKEKRTTSYPDSITGMQGEDNEK